MGVLYVTSLYDGDGKTAFSAGLSHLLGERGQRPVLVKPVRINRPTTSGDPDADAALFASLQSSSPPDGWPVDVEAQEAAEGLNQRTRERVMAAFQKIANQATEIIVEGPSMVTSPEGTIALAPELAEALDARVVLVVRYSTLLKAEDILGPAKSLGNRLVGVVVNRVLHYRNHHVQDSLVASLRKQSVPVAGVVPEERCLLGVTVGQLAQHLGAEFLLWEEKGDQLVDHLMIGGWILDSGVHYFDQSESKAVIVRGDRPDIQMAALHTPTRCLILTGGHRPIQYVEYEAKEEGVPIILVQSDTLTTAKALEALFYGATVHHPAKVECFARLLDRTVDLAAIAPVVGRV